MKIKVEDMSDGEVARYIAEVCGFDMFIQQGDALREIAKKLEQLLEQQKEFLN